MVIGARLLILTVAYVGAQNDHALLHPRTPNCPVGYVDSTKGNAYWWECANDCPGNLPWADSQCACACVGASGTIIASVATKPTEAPTSEANVQPAPTTSVTVQPHIDITTPAMLPTTAAPVKTQEFRQSLVTSTSGFLGQVFFPRSTNQARAPLPLSTTNLQPVHVIALPRQQAATVAQEQGGLNWLVVALIIIGAFLGCVIFIGFWIRNVLLNIEQLADPKRPQTHTRRNEEKLGARVSKVSRVHPAKEMGTPRSPAVVSAPFAVCESNMRTLAPQPMALKNLAKADSSTCSPSRTISKISVSPRSGTISKASASPRSCGAPK